MDRITLTPDNDRPELAEALEADSRCPACGERLIFLRGLSRCLHCNFTICDACESLPAPEG
jgi:hypothetical protein